MAGKTQYWFPAKQYGWGWGPPASWQGWVVIGAYVGLSCLSLLSFKLYRLITLSEYFAVAIVLTLGLVVVCWLKGEPPRWRWGKD